MKSKDLILIVNFGGPRSLAEVEPFLKSLLTDKDVIRTNLPGPLQSMLFTRVAKKRSVQIAKDYEEIGGKSPIFDDTEAIAQGVGEKLGLPVLTFHRYLPATHYKTLAALESSDAERIHVFPMFPHFSYATTGSIARLFEKQLSQATLNKMLWVKSYPTHPSFIALIQDNIRAFLAEKSLKEEEVVLLFSAHGLPKKFIETGDLYQLEVEMSVAKVMQAFPGALGKLAYQSKFGPEEWLMPYTVEVCEQIRGWHEGREHIVFVPISFTSDHIETLFEIEKQYLPIVVDQGLTAHRLSAFNRDERWVQAIVNILTHYNPASTSMLVRKRT